MGPPTPRGRRGPFERLQTQRHRSPSRARRTPAPTATGPLLCLAVGACDGGGGASGVRPGSPNSGRLRASVPGHAHTALHAGHISLGGESPHDRPEQHRRPLEGGRGGARPAPTQWSYLQPRAPLAQTGAWPPRVLRAPSGGGGQPRSAKVRCGSASNHPKVKRPLTGSGEPPGRVVGGSGRARS